MNFGMHNRRRMYKSFKQELAHHSLKLLHECVFIAVSVILPLSLFSEQMRLSVFTLTALGFAHFQQSNLVSYNDLCAPVAGRAFFLVAHHTDYRKIQQASP